MTQLQTATPEFQTATIKKVTRRLIPLLILFYVLAFVDRSAIGFAKLTMNADLGLSEAMYGLGAGLFFIGYFLFEVPSNLLMHRFGARKWFARILLTWGLITALMAFAQGPVSFYILRFLLGAAEAGFFPGVIFYLTLWYPAKFRKSATSQFVLAQPIALMLMAPLAGWMLGLSGFGMQGWQWLFIVVGVAAMLGAVPCLKYLTDRPKNADWLAPQEAQWIEDQLTRDAAESGAADHKNPLRALLDKRVLLLGFVYVLLCTGVYGLGFWLPTVIKAFGVSNMVTGLLTMIPYVAAIAGLLFTAWAVKRYNGNYLPLAIAFGGSAVGMFMSTVFSQPTLQLVFLSLCAFFIFPTTSTFWPIPSSILVGATAAAGIAAINSIGNLGGFVGPYIVGAIADATGSTRYGMVFLSGCLALACVMVGVVKATLGKRAARVEPDLQPAETLV